MMRSWRWPWERGQDPGALAEAHARLADADIALARTRERWPAVRALVDSIGDEGRANHLQDRLRAAFEAKR